MIYSCIDTDLYTNLYGERETELETEMNSYTDDRPTNVCDNAVAYINVELIMLDYVHF